MSNYEFVIGQRDSKLLLFRNYLYNKDREKEGITHWRCRNRGCKARCTIDEMGELTSKKFHNHAPFKQSEIVTMRLLSNLKNAATTSEDRSMNVVTRNLVSANEEVIRNLPRERSLTRIVQRERASALPEFVPTIPEIPETL